MDAETLLAEYRSEHARMTSARCGTARWRDARREANRIYGLLLAQGVSTADIDRALND